MPYPSEHSARLKDPSRYERFRRENDKFGPGIHAVWGITADGKAELQAIRFDVAKFSVAEAKAWLKEHGHKPILFEPASEKAEGSAESLAGQGEEFLVVEAASGEGPTGRIRVMGVAYSGGKMRLPGWRHPVVVDLAGLEVPDAVPLLTNHENRTGARVGMVKARVDGQVLVVEGEILSSSGQARGIVEQARAGAEWQLSIGAEVLEWDLVRSRRVVNGLELRDDVQSPGRREVIALGPRVEVDRHVCVRALARPRGGSAMGSGRPPAGRQSPSTRTEQNVAEWRQSEPCDFVHDPARTVPSAPDPHVLSEIERIIACFCRADRSPLHRVGCDRSPGWWCRSARENRLMA